MMMMTMNGNDDESMLGSLVFLASANSEHLSAFKSRAGLTLWKLRSSVDLYGQVFPSLLSSAQGNAVLPPLSGVAMAQA
eukprot:563765-Amphidinium_carterae.1